MAASPSCAGWLGARLRVGLSCTAVAGAGAAIEAAKARGTPDESRQPLLGGGEEALRSFGSCYKALSEKHPMVVKAIATAQEAYE